jgi:hypothetical protein
VVATIAVDFDGVIHAYSKGWHDGTIYDEPVPGAVVALTKLMDDYAVYVHTTRNAVEVAAWLVKWTGLDVRVDYILDGPTFWSEQDKLLVSNRKLPAVAYIDDRAIHFTDWTEALAEVRRRET